MRKIVGRFVLGLALALLLSAALSGGAMAEKYVIDSGVWSHFQGYLKAIGKIRPGAFAITKDGRGSYYVWCQETRCVAGPSYGQEARNACESSYETECVIFAVRDEIRVEYEVAPRAESPSDLPDLAPPTLARISVSPDIQAEIDTYLRNVQSAGRVWAFAIAKDGSDGAMASCPAGSTYSGGSACYPILGTMQELAKREAIKRCGGAGDCVLLYIGAQKQGNVEVVAR
jgi:hypothetical protein